MRPVHPSLQKKSLKKLKNMILKLRQLIQILLISFLIIFFFVLSFAHSNENNCNYFSENSLNLQNQNYPSLIEIETPNFRKWFQYYSRRSYEGI